MTSLRDWLLDDDLAVGLPSAYTDDTTNGYEGGLLAVSPLGDPVLRLRQAPGQNAGLLRILVDGDDFPASEIGPWLTQFGSVDHPLGGGFKVFTADGVYQEFWSYPDGDLLLQMGNEGGGPKIGFFGATPSLQPHAADADGLFAALKDIGLIDSSSATGLVTDDISGFLKKVFPTNQQDGLTLADGAQFVVSDWSGNAAFRLSAGDSGGTPPQLQLGDVFHASEIRIGSMATDALAFWGGGPDVQQTPASFAALVSALKSYGLIASGSLSGLVAGDIPDLSSEYVPAFISDTAGGTVGSWSDTTDGYAHYLSAAGDDYRGAGGAQYVRIGADVGLLLTPPAGFGTIMEIHGKTGSDPLYIFDNANGSIFKAFGNGDILIAKTGGKLGFYGSVAVTKPAVTGSRVANPALASLLSQLASLGLITDSSS